MSRHLYVLLTLLFGSLAFAVDVLEVEAAPDTLTFSSERIIRYYTDYAEGTVLIPDVRLAGSTPFPDAFNVNVAQDAAYVEITIDGPFRVTLSGDEKTLRLVRGESLGAEPRSAATDERAPVVYYLANAEPSRAAAFLKNFYENLQIEVDERQRSIYVRLNPNDRELVDQLVASFDSARPQVMFEAEILEINQDMTQSLGINYDSIFSLSLTEGAPESILGFSPFARNPLAFNFGLNLLKTNGAAEVLARPRVTTLDGVEAQLNATQTVPLLLPGTNGKSSSVQNITTGIKLTLLPKISPDGTVEAELSISVSTPTGTTSQGVPQFSSREASTTVRVANGEPIAIGGLLEKREIEGKQKVPILGDIPILGKLFTSTRTEKRETDLVITVTPRIVDMAVLPTLQDTSTDVPSVQLEQTE